MEGRLFTRRRAIVGLAAVLAIASVVGFAAPAEAIVGGKPTTPFSYPYYVQLRIYKYSSTFQYATCGGSLIDSQWVLTAAHCMTNGAQKQEIGVQALILDNCNVSAVELRIHPLWDGDVTNGHDLALLRIPNGSAHCVGSSGNQIYPRPIQVGDVSDTGAYAAGTPATIVGHGATKAGGSATKELRYLWTSIRSDSDMSDIYDHIWSTNWNSRLMIGAGDSQHTACNGDSGGPLTVDRSQGTVQVGVASFGHSWPSACDEAAGFARLAGPQLAWISANVPAANIGSCSLNYGSIPGHWTASYSQSGTGSDADGPYRYGFTCVRQYPTTYYAASSSQPATSATA